MLECPSCKVRTLDSDLKFYASALFPVTCPKCGKHVGIRGAFCGSYAAVSEFVIIGVVLLAIGMKPTATGVALLAFFCVINLPLGAMRPLSLFTAKEISTARLLSGVGLMVVGALGVWGLLRG